MSSAAGMDSQRLSAASRYVRIRRTSFDRIKVMNSTKDFLRDRYEALWQGAMGEVRKGRVTMDPLLARREPDLRRCLTVLARPSVSVQQSVASFLNQLRAVDPEQYYYDPAELHVTVLSLFTATVDHGPFFARYGEYLAAVKGALAGARTFGIEFSGVTLTRDAVMIQGLLEDTILNDLRETLRQELRARCLTEGLDGRYVLQTAHMTVVRFRAPLRDSTAYLEVLERCRRQSFGRTQVRELNLVRNDWYMSQASVEIRERFQLSSNSDPQGSQPA
jgi:2'-5' RNA ligase